MPAYGAAQPTFDDAIPQPEPIGPVGPQGQTHADPGLPPAGHLRDEELRRRADSLAAEQEAKGADAFAWDPRALAIDNEIATHFNELAVTNADPAYVYCWVYAPISTASNTGIAAVQRKKSQRILYQGAPRFCWEVVEGDMRECWELRTSTPGTQRRIGDVILMRCHRDLYAVICAQQDYMNAQRLNEGVGEGELRSIADHYGLTLKSTIDNPDDPRIAQMHKKAAGSRMGFQRLRSHIVSGTVPGMPAPGVR